MRDYKAESTRCTALNRGGKFCDRESLPDAPYPACILHASMLLRYLNSYMPESVEDRVLVAVRGMEQGRERQAERQRYKPTDGCVYYVRVGELVKIGYTEVLGNRMKAYPPDSELLAVEPGTLALEYRRHQQFAADLKHGREWFKPSAALLAHIDQVHAASAALQTAD